MTEPPTEPSHGTFWQTHVPTLPAIPTNHSSCLQGLEWLPSRPGSLPSRWERHANRSNLTPSRLSGSDIMASSPRTVFQDASTGWGSAEVWEQVSAESSEDTAEGNLGGQGQGQFPARWVHPGWGQAREGGCLTVGRTRGACSHWPGHGCPLPGPCVFSCHNRGSRENKKMTLCRRRAEDG